MVFGEKVGTYKEVLQQESPYHCTCEVKQHRVKDVEVKYIDSHTFDFQRIELGRVVFGRRTYGRGVCEVRIQLDMQ